MTAAQKQGPRLELAADSDWKFLLGDPSGAESRDFADAPWRTVNLPHDWSIEGVPNKDNPTGSGGGFFPAGLGWYRKTFNAPVEWRGKRVSVEFDGVYKDATVYLNGRKLGMHPYGYTGFIFDLTPDLDFSGRNVLAVRVDNSAQPNSRWYSGSGIYRHVRVVVTDSTHVAHWGVNGKDRSRKRQRSKPGDCCLESCAMVAGVTRVVPGSNTSAKERSRNG
jgi:beta-galactosidase